MNTSLLTFEEVQEYNTKNKSKNKNIFRDIILSFKNKILDIISPKKVENIQIGKVKNIINNENKPIQFINKNTTNYLLNKLELNNFEKNKLDIKLREEIELLNHLEKINLYIPTRANNEILTLKGNIKKINDKLISIEIENLRINSKLNPLRKIDKEWETNIFNPVYNGNIIEKKEEDTNENIIKRLYDKLELEQKLLQYFETKVKDNQYDLKLIKENILKIIKEIKSIEKDKNIDESSQLFKGEENTFNTNNKIVKTNELSTIEKINISIDEQETSLLKIKKSLSELINRKNEENDNIDKIIKINTEIKLLEDNLIYLKIQKIRIGGK